MIAFILLAILHCTSGDKIEFHLLTPNGYPKNIGVLLVAKNNSLSAVSFEAIRKATNPEKVCQIMGFDSTKSSFMYADSEISKIPNDDLNDLARGLKTFKCSRRAENASDCAYEWKDKENWDYTSPVAVVMCGRSHNGTLQLGGLRLFADINGTQSGEGVAVLFLQNPTTGEYYQSVLCAADRRAADLACQHNGFDKADSVIKNNFNYLSRDFTKYFQYLVHTISCEGASVIEGCTIEYTDSENDVCKEGDEVTLLCRNERYQLDNISLVASKKNKLKVANMGIPQVYLKSEDRYSGGLVYQANYRAMELACRFMGMKFVKRNDTNTDFKYASKKSLMRANYLIESVNCPDAAKDFHDCDILYAGERTLDYGKEVVFECGNDHDKDANKYGTVKYKFDGVKGSFKVKKSKGIVPIEDIIDFFLNI